MVLDGLSVLIAFSSHFKDTTAGPASHFVASLKDLFHHVLANVGDGDMVGITIIMKLSKVIGQKFSFSEGGISYRRVLYGTLLTVTQSQSNRDPVRGLTCWKP